MITFRWQGNVEKFNVTASRGCSVLAVILTKNAQTEIPQVRKYVSNYPVSLWSPTVQISAFLDQSFSLHSAY